MRQYAVGEFVWLFTPQIGKNRVKKLSRLWKGPNKIVAIKSDLNVKLKICGRIVSVYVNWIKPYVERIINFVFEDEEDSDADYVTDEEPRVTGVESHPVKEGVL